MASLDDIVPVTISLSAATTSRVGFGRTAILDVLPGAVGTAWGSDKWRLYTSLDEMADDDFETTDAAYIAASLMQSQNPRPPDWIVYKRATAVAQITTITVATVTDGAVYSGTATIDGVSHAWTYTADGSATNAEISAGITAAITALALTAFVVATNPTATTVVLTSQIAGLPFTVASDTVKLTVATGTANVGPAEDIAALRLLTDDWYNVQFTQNEDHVKRIAAATVEALSKIFTVMTTAAGTYDSGSTSDLAYRLKALDYARTSVWYHATATEPIDAAMAGLMLPKTPGTNTWFAKKVSGIVVDSLTGAQSTAVLAKNANTYETIGGGGWTRNGTMADGGFIDAKIFNDYLAANIQADVADAIRGADVMPFTDKGIAVISGTLRGTLRGMEARGQIDSGWTVAAPKLADVSAADRSARTLNGLTFHCVYSSGIHKIPISGVVVE